MPNNTDVSSNQNKKSRLGRGLGSLLGGMPEPEQDRPAAAAAPVANQATRTEASAVKIEDSERIWKLSIEKLSANQNQPRKEFDPVALKELSDSIREKGILQPIVARRLAPNKFEIIAGERRWRAAQMAGLHEVPVILRESDDQDSFELAIIENIQRADLNPVEEAEAFDLLMQKYELTQMDIAKRVGKDRATLANSLRLLGLPQDVKQLLRTRELSAGHAKVILSISDSSQQSMIAKAVVAQKLSVRATEKLVAQTKFREPGTGAQVATEIESWNVSEKLVAGLAAELQKLVGSKVGIEYRKGKGHINIAFYDDEQLNHLIEKLRKAWSK